MLHIRNLITSCSEVVFLIDHTRVLVIVVALLYGRIGSYETLLI